MIQNNVTVKRPKVAIKRIVQTSIGQFSVCTLPVKYLKSDCNRQAKTILTYWKSGKSSTILWKVSAGGLNSSPLFDFAAVKSTWDCRFIRVQQNFCENASLLRLGLALLLPWPRLPWPLMGCWCKVFSLFRFWNPGLREFLRSKSENFAIISIRNNVRIHGKTCSRR